MSDVIEGGCLCRQVRYRYEGDPAFSFHCQCRRCQHITGGGHSSAFAVELDRLTITGKLKGYDSLSDAGYTATSLFCPDCGSPVLSKSSRAPERGYIHAGSMDDPDRFKPRMVIFSDGGQPWDHMDPDLDRPE